MKKILFAICMSMLLVSCGKMPFTFAEDEAVMDALRKLGGVEFTVEGTAISTDGTTTFTITPKGTNTVVVGVTGKTGNDVSFTNQDLEMKLIKNVLIADDEDLRVARYISFTGALVVEDGYLGVALEYQTVASGVFTASWATPIE